jgi:hypothetical protein
VHGETKSKKKKKKKKKKEKEGEFFSSCRSSRRLVRLGLFDVVFVFCVLFVCGRWFEFDWKKSPITIKNLKNEINI